MNKSKKKKTAPYRSALSNALWSFHGLLKGAPFLFLLMVLAIPLNVCLSYTEIYLPSLVVAEVTGNAPLEQAALKTGAVILLMLTCHILLNISDCTSQGLLDRYRRQKSREIDRKSLNQFFQEYEKKEIRDLSDRAAHATYLWNGVLPICDVPRRSLKLIENALNYLLFGSVISIVSPLLVPLLTLAPAVNWFCARAYRRWQYSHREMLADIDRKLWYLQEKSSDFKAAKDIRIYGMAGWFREVFSDLSGRRLNWEKKNIRRLFLSRVADLFIILLRDGAAYLLLIRMMLNGEVTVDRFLLYFSAISMFASFIGNIMNEWNGIRATSLDVCDYRRYLDLPEQDGSGEANVEAHLKTAPEITFEHVSFRYEGAQADTLQDISFTIKPGENIALVGLNGAGKTTLVKMLCGLYHPTSGDIKINGISFKSFYRKDYYRLFSPVFQDVQSGFFSLADTVSGQIQDCWVEADTGEDTRTKKHLRQAGKAAHAKQPLRKAGKNTPAERFLRQADRDTRVEQRLQHADRDTRAEQCLRQAGLGEKLDTLPHGIHSMLDKQLYPDGIELSGGELQKLMLARAIYKDAPILVLDEPTAALDPIAENRIYLQYQDLTRSKTSLFISHRLASTQFCDRVLFLKDGKVAEEGTHRELMALGGEYAKLYEIQSCWYREDNAATD